ncbi:hypothetical protein KAU19_03905 [Candidatus Parcubacteria bacterium]|nr:hypothetical protein [Candidatus Parcubacteria bacterium]
MLEQLFGSRARVKILKLFLLNPNEKFYIRELSRRLKLQLNSVRRELENLERFGILSFDFGIGEGLDNKNNKSSRKKSRYISNIKQEKKYYQVNPDFILFEEIKLLIMKAQILYERDFIEKLEKIGKPKLLILTGIFVNKSSSTIDLLLVGRFNKNKLAKLIKELEYELGKEVNYALMDNKEFKYRKDVTDRFLYNILEGVKIVAIDRMGVS